MPDLGALDGASALLERKLMKKRLLCLVLVCTGPVGLLSAQTKQTNGSMTFDKLRSLSGSWEGTFVWSGVRNASGKMGGQYYTTGNGSALVENLTVDGTPIMTSVYHLDGADLRLTHFCAAQNQPRLKATAFDLDNGQITFSFVDITNLRSPTAGHVQGLEVRFLGPDHITLRFRFVGDGKDSDELIDLKRKR
jgi:hypothetical protein